MRHYIARQLVQFVVVILGISILAFAILHVLGDPVLLLLPQNAGKEEFERYRHLDTDALLATNIDLLVEAVKAPPRRSGEGDGR